MRTFILVAAAVLGLAAADAVPQKIVFARVFPNAGQISLFISAADGSDERPLLTAGDVDYNPVWAPDGASIVFTSDRDGSADLFRVKPDGTGFERLTDDPAYDDQAAFSPDGNKLVFVSSRQGGFTRLWTMDLRTRRAKALTSTPGPGGEFRPSWSPDASWIAFTSDRGSPVLSAHGRWEPLHVVDVYVIRSDGSGLKRLTEHGDSCGSPKWTQDSRHVIVYCMTVEQTLANRQARPLPGNDTRLVSIDVASGASVEVPAGPGVKFNPSFVGATVGYIRKDNEGTGAGIYYADGRNGPKGDVRAVSWSPDGARVVFHRRLTAPPITWRKTFSRNPAYELTLTGILPSFSPAGDRFVMVGRPKPGFVLGSSLAVAATGTDKSEVIYQDMSRNVLGPQWSPSGDTIIFGVGVYNAFFNGFNGRFLKPGERAEGGAQIAVIRPDGTGFREVTSGPNNNGFPSMAPDGRRFVYRSFGQEADGLRIMNMDTNVVTTLTNGYDNFPLWSPRGDLITFVRQADGDYEIYTIKPDGTDVRRLTYSRGNDAHMAWSPDGTQIAFASTRMGFKDEVTYTDAPQPSGELFVMRSDGTHLQQLTDNEWEDGTPAWQPAGRLVTQR